MFHYSRNSSAFADPYFLRTPCGPLCPHRPQINFTDPLRSPQTHVEKHGAIVTGAALYSDVSLFRHLYVLIKVSVREKVRLEHPTTVLHAHIRNIETPEQRDLGT